MSGSPRVPRRVDPVVAAGIAAGVALRLLIYLTPLGRPDSDEVVAGLMVAHIPQTGFPVFFWGQDYGGTPELGPVWVGLTAFGFNIVGLRAATAVLGALNAWLLYRVARRRLPEPAARLAGVLLFTGPAAALWFGVHEQLFYPPTTTAGLVVLLCAHRLADRSDGPHRRAWGDAAGLGLAAGIGWWMAPNIVYYLIPAAAVLLAHARRTVTPATAVLAAGGFLAGAAPWLVQGSRTNWGPLRATENFPRLGSYPGRVEYFFERALAGALGPRDVLSHDWAWGAVGVVLYLGLLVVLGRGWWQAVRARSWEAVGFVGYVVVYAAIGWSPDDPNLRYTFYAAPILVLLAVRGVWSAGAAHRARSLATLGVAVALSAMSLGRLWHLSEAGGTVYRVGNVPELHEVIEALDARGITRVWGDYWVAYRLDFETGERIVSSPAAGIVRYQPYHDLVRASPRSAWVVLRGRQLDAFTEAMAAKGVAWERVEAGGFVVAVPARPVQPEELPDAARRAPETPRPEVR